MQEAGAKNHQLIEDFTFQVTQEGQKQTFPLYNEQLTVKVRVKNTDFDSNLPILEQGATFQIKNLDTNEYLTDIDGEKIIFTTNNLGITEMYLLASGNYQVEQINAVDTYQVNNNSFPFIITEEADFLEDENHQKYLEIIVPNKKIKSRIEIEKWTEYYFNDIFKEKKQNIDLEIPIYAKEDIYSKDGVKLYEKDQIVSTALWNGETILTDDLYLGTFYLVNPIDESIIEVILDSEKTKKVELLEQVFEYSKEQEQEQIDVPNTITKKTNVSYLGTIFLFSGFILYQKGKKNEN